MSMNASNIYILNIKNVNYCCFINGISKSETMELLENMDFTETKWNVIKKISGAVFEPLNWLEILIKKVKAII